MKIGRCPFCGGEDADVDCADVDCDFNDILVYYVVCSCGAMSMDCDSKEEAIEKWNTVSEKVYG